ncbi:glutathione peroxidase [Porticoccaceae bacterium]|nr:glutathione peroxidase [Porticoccaceae bacterium]MDA8663540.1 glutathione peroxidase [Porticoccaceae bacterium]MDA8682634.1 glutathione peroxidase [Porticoccaceae bacterium]MDB2635033.1 glutathione peroxidase [Porticoccaceae bacterium]MDB2663618.1 glutathione peroxidase [Porticoccaceae bacterium]
MTNTIYDFSLPTSNQGEQSLADFKGKVILIVNTASQCGFTPQYEGLQTLHDKYHENGLVVVAVPCNQFGAQEPGSNETIQEFCQLNYGLSFPVMGKIDVNGANQHPLYNYLTTQAKGLITDSIKWNFTKFLVDKEGAVVERFAPITKPDAIERHIEKLL